MIRLYFYNPPEKIQDVGVWGIKKKESLTSFAVNSPTALLAKPSKHAPQAGVLDFQRGVWKEMTKNKTYDEVLGAAQFTNV